MLLFHCIALKINKLLVLTFRFYKSQQQNASILSEQQILLFLQSEGFNFNETENLLPFETEILLKIDIEFIIIGGNRKKF